MKSEISKPMSNRKNQNHISLNNSELEKKGFKFWLEDDEILRIKVVKIMTEEMIEVMVREFEEIAKRLSPKGKILINISEGPQVSTSMFRKRAVESIKNTFSTFRFGKMAIYGGGVLQKVGLSFILVAVGLKNIQYFKTEKEALKWLKE